MKFEKEDIHQSKIEAIDIKLEVAFTGSNHIEHEVVVTGSSDGQVKIWWNGGQVFHCQKQHSSLIQEVSTFTTQLRSTKNRS